MTDVFFLFQPGLTDKRIGEILTANL